MSAAWLLSQAHEVSVYESATRAGGHSNTIDVPSEVPGGKVPVDMGFIVFNPPNYPNLTALFRHLEVPTQPSEMSFAVSLRGGALEYAGTDLGGLFAQKRNLVRPRFWAMLRDLARFYREAAGDAARLAGETSLGHYLDAHGYGDAFIRDHLLPMAAAIWSAPAERMADHPAAAFIRFCDNHGLLRLRDRPEWRTVTGGSRVYVQRLTAGYADRIRLGCGVRSVRRLSHGVRVHDTRGVDADYDHVVIAAHSDQALAMLADPSEAECALLGAIGYGANEGVMHRDRALMPRRRRAWSSWNYIGARAGDPDAMCASYWMNRLQGLRATPDVFVTLNPVRAPDPATVIHRESFTHPQFDAAALRAQRDLWSLQGRRNTWFCGAWFGAGFHEDGLQAGLAVAEALGGVRRPWTVADPSGRIARGDPAPSSRALAA
jgi:predicted NAD/FAD-binding protein